MADLGRDGDKSASYRDLTVRVTNFRSEGSDDQTIGALTILVLVSYSVDLDRCSYYFNHH